MLNNSNFYWIYSQRLTQFAEKFLVFLFRFQCFSYIAQLLVLVCRRKCFVIYLSIYMSLCIMLVTLVAIAIAVIQWQCFGNQTLLNKKKKKKKKLLKCFMCNSSARFKHFLNFGNVFFFFGICFSLWRVYIYICIIRVCICVSCAQWHSSCKLCAYHEYQQGYGPYSMLKHS